MTSHRHFREMLARRAELTPNDERRLRAHLEGCAECRATSAAYEQQLRLLRSLPTLPTPPTLRSTVLQRIHASPPRAVPWYRRRPDLMPPLTAAAVLALIVVVWIGASRLNAQHGTQNASSAPTLTPTPQSGGKVSRTQTPLSVGPVSPRIGSSKHSIARHPVHHPSHAVNGAAASGRASTSSPASRTVFPAPVFGGVRITATPISFSPGVSVAAGVPTVSTRPTPIQLTATGPARQGRPSSHRTAGAAQAQPTARPTSGPVGIAVGPPPATAPPAKPPALAPIRVTPSPVAAVQTPIVVVTSGVVATPLPIVPSTPAPSTIVPVFSVPSTVTPTPTPTAQP